MSRWRRKPSSQQACYRSFIIIFHCFSRITTTLQAQTLLKFKKQQIQLLQLVTTYTLRVLQSCCKVNNKYNASPWTLSADCPGEALFIVVSMQQPLVRTGLEEAISWRSCSITWHSFSPWHNLSKLSSAHGLPKELLLVVKVVQVVFFTCPRISKTYVPGETLQLVVKVVQVVFPTQQVVLETIPRPSIPRSARHRWLPRRCHPHSLLLLHRGTSRGGRCAARSCCRGGCGRGTTCGSRRQSSRPRW